ncbi:hypothetical protein GN956_G11051 [Arapaima gigas]
MWTPVKLRAQLDSCGSAVQRKTKNPGLCQLSYPVSRKWQEAQCRQLEGSGCLRPQRSAWKRRIQAVECGVKELHGSFMLRRLLRVDLAFYLFYCKPPPPGYTAAFPEHTGPLSLVEERGAHRHYVYTKHEQLLGTDTLSILFPETAQMDHTVYTSRTKPPLHRRHREASLSFLNNKKKSKAVFFPSCLQGWGMRSLDILTDSTLSNSSALLSYENTCTADERNFGFRGCMLGGAVVLNTSIWVRSH